jgi:hypothetical protein
MRGASSQKLYRVPPAWLNTLKRLLDWHSPLLAGYVVKYGPTAKTALLSPLLFLQRIPSFAPLQSFPTRAFFEDRPPIVQTHVFGGGCISKSFGTIRACVGDVQGTPPRSIPPDVAGRDHAWGLAIVRYGNHIPGVHTPRVHENAHLHSGVRFAILRREPAQNVHHQSGVQQACGSKRRHSRYCRTREVHVLREQSHLRQRGRFR